MYTTPVTPQPPPSPHHTSGPPTHLGGSGCTLAQSGVQDDFIQLGVTDAVVAQAHQASLPEVVGVCPTSDDQQNDVDQQHHTHQDHHHWILMETETATQRKNPAFNAWFLNLFNYMSTCITTR